MSRIPQVDHRSKTEHADQELAARRDERKKADDINQLAADQSVRVTCAIFAILPFVIVPLAWLCWYLLANWGCTSGAFNTLGSAITTKCPAPISALAPVYDAAEGVAMLSIIGFPVLLLWSAVMAVLSVTYGKARK